MDRLESMTAFVAVVTAGSFSGASRQLRMPLPTLSRKVSELEAHLKTTLLIRSTRKLVLTEAGQSYLAGCRGILENLAELERSALGEYSSPRGELVVTAPVVFGRLHVLPVAAEFLQLYPAVDLRLVLADRTLPLVDEQLDLAVRIGELPDSGLMAARVGQVRSVVCASPAYLEARGTPKTPAALSGHDCVSFGALTGPDRWEFRGESVHVHSRLTVNTAEAAIDAAIAGTGLARALSYQVAPACKAGQLRILLKRFEPPPLPVTLVYARATSQTAKLRAFIDFAAPRLRTRLSSALARCD